MTKENKKIWKIEDGNIEAIPSLDEVIQFITQQKEVGFDIETTRKFGGEVFGDNEGLDPRTSSIVMLQIGDEKTQYVIDNRQYNEADVMPVIELLSERTIVGHNLKFEYVHILHNFGIRLTNMYDTMVVEQILECGEIKSGRFSLGHLMKKYINPNIDPKKQVRLEFLDIENKPFSKEQLIYGAMDIITPLYIKKAQEKLLHLRDLKDTYYMLEKHVTPVLGEKEYNGMHINQKLWLDLFQKNMERYLKAENDLNSYVEKNLSKFTEDGVCNILWTSPKQVLPLMQAVGVDTKVKDKKKSKELGHPVYKDSIETSHLMKYLHSDRLVELYVEFKRIQKSVTSYGDKFLRFVNPITGRIHPNYWQVLNTGRTACRNPKEIGALVSNGY
jgi:DNA polymerase-1